MQYKLAARHFHLLSTLIMVCLMTWMMSGTLLWLHVGFVDHFFRQWVHSFLSVILIAQGFALIARPIAFKIARWLTHTPINQAKQRL